MVAGALLLFSLIGADPGADLDHALKLLDDAQFAAAATELDALIYPPSLSKELLPRARLALAEAYFFSNRIDNAKLELERLLKKSPAYKVDRKRLPPDFLALYDDASASETRAHRSDKLVRPSRAAPAPEVVAPVASAPEAASQPARPASEASQHAPPQVAPWYVKILPFGVGQFANRDIVGGSVFLSLTLAATAANVVLAVYNAKQRLPDGNYPTHAGYPSLYVLQDVAAGAAILFAVAGVVDAFVWSPARGAQRVALQAALSPAGGGLSIAGGF